MQRGINFKELAHMIMETGKSKICRVSQQAGDTRKSQCCSSSLQISLPSEIYKATSPCICQPVLLATFLYLHRVCGNVFIHSISHRNKGPLTCRAPSKTLYLILYMKFCVLFLRKPPPNLHYISLKTHKTWIHLSEGANRHFEELKVGLFSLLNYIGPPLLLICGCLLVGVGITHISSLLGILNRSKARTLSILKRQCGKIGVRVSQSLPFLSLSSFFPLPFN